MQHNKKSFSRLGQFSSYSIPHIPSFPHVNTKVGVDLPDRKVIILKLKPPSSTSSCSFHHDHQYHPSTSLSVITAFPFMCSTLLIIFLVCCFCCCYTWHKTSLFRHYFIPLIAAAAAAAVGDNELIFLFPFPAPLFFVLLKI